jgi:proton glutamate symport protein
MSLKHKALIYVLLGIFLGVFFGRLAGTTASLFGITFYSVFDLLGALFINVLSLAVVPLVACAITTGVTKMAKDNSFGRLGLKTFGFYIVTTFFAVLVGVVLVNFFQPGLAMQESLAQNGDHIAIAKKHLETLPSPNVRQVFLDIIPSNILWAFSKNQMLAVIFFSLFFGYCLSKVKTVGGDSVLNWCEGVFQTMIEFIHLVLKLLPLGVFCLVAKTFATTGIESLKGLSLFALTVLLGLLIFAGLFLPLLLKVIAKVSPWRHFKAMGPAIVTAFSTSSSSATLPVTIDCVEKRAKVSNKICSLVVPLGTSMNMSGSALYECVAALFVAQVYGLKISLVTQFLVGSLALLTSLGVAGIPGGSLVAVIIILQTIGLPAEGIGLFIAVDRILDMCRTTINVFSDSCCAVLVAKTEGEKGVLASDNFDEPKPRKKR